MYSYLVIYIQISGTEKYMYIYITFYIRYWIIFNMILRYDFVCASCVPKRTKAIGCTIQMHIQL